MKLSMHKPTLPMAARHVDSAKANTHSLRGTSRSRWSVLRASILQRDCGLCQECLRHDWPKAAAEVDHIVGLQFGGDDSPRNLQSLCVACHRSKTRQEAAGHQPNDYWSGMQPDAA